MRICAASMLATVSFFAITAHAAAQAEPGVQSGPPVGSQDETTVDPTSAQETVAAGQEDTIVVTGSRIVRDGYTAPTPVTVARTEDLALTVPTNIPDALNTLPQFQNSLSPGQSAANFASIPIHGNILNLRGLGTPSPNPKGPLRTLVLFDGIRVPATTYIGTVDTNVLPNLLVERVDVVTGGASASYGSDAVAGVVNFVLDQDYTGLKGQAQAGISERGDTATQRIGLAGGMDFADGRGHVLVSGEYFNNDGLLRSQRDYGRRSLTYVGSNPDCLGAGTPECVAGGANNPLVVASNVNIAVTNSLGQIGQSTAAGFPFSGQVSNGDGTFRPFRRGELTGTPAFQIGGDGYSIPSDTAAITPYETYSAFGRASYEFNDTIGVFAQGIYSRANLSYRSLANSILQGPGVRIYRDNPFLTPELRATLPTSEDYFNFTQYTPSNPKPTARENTDFYLVSGGIELSLGDWEGGVTYTHGQSIHNVAQSGLYDYRKLYAAVDAVRDPATGQVTCRVLLNPALADQYAGCQPVDVLRGPPSATTPDGYAYATGTSRYRGEITQDSVVATISGSPFELPAGPVDIVAGAEYRSESLQLTSNADPAQLDEPAERAAYFDGLRGVPGSALFYWLTNVGTANGDLEVKEAFGEIAVPILADLPGARELNVNGAVRYTDYSTSGDVVTYKVGATWRPVYDLLLRGLYSRDIRAPNLYELFRGDTSGIGIVNDPVTGINQNVPTVSGGNPNLQPEVANTYSFGGVLTPNFLPGFSLSVDYYSVDVNQAIDSLSAQQIVDDCALNGPTSPTCSLITRGGATGAPTLIRIAEANVASLKTSGIDFDGSYRTRIGSDSLALRLYANYLETFESQQTAAQPVLDFTDISFVGSNPVAYPRWSGSLQATYESGPFGITVTERYIDGMTIGRPGQPSNFVDDQVDAVFYTDLSVRFNLDDAGMKDGQFFFVANNLFDRQPPIIPSTIPGVNLPTNISVYDIVGRTYTAGVRFEF